MALRLPIHREAASRLHPKLLSQAWERGFKDTGFVVSLSGIDIMSII